jgi:hypothetical protein
VAAGWATPTSRDHKDGAGSLENVPINALLGRQVTLAGWATPRQTDGDKNVRSPAGAMREIERKGAQNDLGLVSGLMPSGSDASTASRGALNPLFSLWLMLGDASAVVAWASAAPATKNRRGSAC